MHDTQEDRIMSSHPEPVKAQIHEGYCWYGSFTNINSSCYEENDLSLNTKKSLI